MALFTEAKSPPLKERERERRCFNFVHRLIVNLTAILNDLCISRDFEMDTLDMSEAKITLPVLLRLIDVSRVILVSHETRESEKTRSFH